MNYRKLEFPLFLTLLAVFLYIGVSSAVAAGLFERRPVSRPDQPPAPAATPAPTPTPQPVTNTLPLAVGTTRVTVTGLCENWKAWRVGVDLIVVCPGASPPAGAVELRAFYVVGG